MTCLKSRLDRLVDHHGSIGLQRIVDVSGCLVQGKGTKLGDIPNGEEAEMGIFNYIISPLLFLEVNVALLDKVLR